jgi:hypothetical protein
MILISHEIKNKLTKQGGQNEKIHVFSRPEGYADAMV